MGVREFFVGDVLHEIELGSFRNLGYSVRQTALIGREGDDAELWIEVMSKRLLPMAVHCVHLPAGGHGEIEAVARTVLDEYRQEPRSAGEWLARAALQVGRIPLLLAFLGFFAFWLLAMLSIITGGFFGQFQWPPPDAGPGWILAYGVGMVAGFALHWGSLWAVSRMLCEPFAASMTRMLVGHPRDIRSMGIGRGPTRHRDRQWSEVSTRVMAAYGRHPWLVVTRSFRTAISANVRLWRIPPEHIQPLLEVSPPTGR